MAVPIRTCVGCRARSPQTEMTRLAVDGAHIINSRTAPGRGAWLHPRSSCFDLAQRRKVWSRAFRQTGLTMSHPPALVQDSE